MSRPVLTTRALIAAGAAALLIEPTTAVATPAAPAPAAPAPAPAAPGATFTALSAGAAPTGSTANAWGTVPGGANASVWTEVKIGSSWSRSQTRTANGSGYFAIPLTYGASSPGTHQWRVGARTANGVQYSAAFTFQRVARPSVNHATSKPTGQRTYAWGGAQPNSTVFSQALVNGRWSTSQTTRSDVRGGYTVPLTYGQNSTGTITFRIGSHTPAGALYTGAFSIKRVPAGPAIDLSREAMWDRIAKCESGNRWNINTGNGYFGGLQFNLATWRSVRGQDFAAYPHQATRAQQITVANRLYAKRGLQPWECGWAA